MQVDRREGRLMRSERQQRWRRAARASCWLSHGPELLLVRDFPSLVSSDGNRESHGVRVDNEE